MDKFLSKYGKSIIVALLTLFLGIDQAGEMLDKFNSGDIEGVKNEVLTTIFEESFAPMQVQITTIAENQEAMGLQIDILEESLIESPDLSVNIIEVTLNKFSTAEQLNTKVDQWELEGWDVQIAASRYIMQSPKAKAKLKEIVIYPEVYRAYIVRANGI